MREVVFHSEARLEYREAIRYYFDIDPDLQTEFRAEFRKHIRLNQSNPLLFRERKYKVRRANFKRFSNYYIAYMVWREQVVLVAIGHARKRPYYWRKRPKQFRDAHPD